MSERKFEYKKVAETYKRLKDITGDANSPDSVAGILHDIDKKYHDLVNVVDEAIYGDLAKQLLLDWENTSSNFGSFVDNFNNWSTLIAQSAGDYSQFEKDVAGFKEANPLGATSKGRKDNYINTSAYSKYTQENLESLTGAIEAYKAVSEVEYLDTNMEEVEKERTKSARISCVFETITTLLSVFGAGKAISSAVKALKAGGTAASITGAATSGTQTTTSGATTTTNTASAAGNSTQNASTLKSKFSSKVSNAKTKVGSAVSNAKTKVGSTVSNAKTKVGSAVSNAKTKVGSTVSKATSKVSPKVKTNIKKAATKVKGTKIGQKAAKIKKPVKTIGKGIGKGIKKGANQIKNNSWSVNLAGASGFAERYAKPKSYNNTKVNNSQKK